MLFPDESNTDASRRSSWPGNTSCRFLMNWYGSFVPRQPRLQTATETFGYTSVYEVIIVDLTQSRRYAFAPCSSQTRNLRAATAAQPAMYKRGEEDDTCLEPGQTNPVRLSASHEYPGESIPAL